MSKQHRASVVVAGASGFIGQALGPSLGDTFSLIGLSRSERTASNGYAGFRKADLFSLKDCEAALQGADFAIYLVHSMMPSARLVQGSFADLDLLCADNFARAAAKNGVKHIVYLGGLLPSDRTLSAHLKSRAEVERVLSSTGVNVTTLRAGLIVGHGGSSFQMVLRLVKRLPVMLCPAWTSTRMQPVAVGDILKALRIVCGQAEHFGKVYDLGCSTPVTYRKLLELTAELIGKKRYFLSVPFFSPGLSRLWVSLTTGAPKDLVGPLVKSLTHEMVVRPSNQLQELETISLRSTLTKAISKSNQAKVIPRAFRMAPHHHEQTVRSVQRMSLPVNCDAQWATAEYLHWLPVGLKGLIRVRRASHDEIHFHLFKNGPVLLVLTVRSHRNDPTRHVLRVTGGLLARATHRGRLEFRQVLDGRTLMAGIHEFEPRLPWWLYRVSQAQFHRYVMYRFSKHLLQIDVPNKHVENT